LVRAFAEDLMARGRHLCGLKRWWRPVRGRKVFVVIPEHWL
jgi:hypothetical protein